MGRIQQWWIRLHVLGARFVCHASQLEYPRLFESMGIQRAPNPIASPKVVEAVCAVRGLRFDSSFGEGHLDGSELEARVSGGRVGVPVFRNRSSGHPSIGFPSVRTVQHAH